MFNKNDILQNKALATLFCSSNKLYPIEEREVGKVEQLMKMELVGKVNPRKTYHCLRIKQKSKKYFIPSNVQFYQLLKLQLFGVPIFLSFLEFIQYPNFLKIFN